MTHELWPGLVAALPPPHNPGIDHPGPWNVSDWVIYAIVVIGIALMGLAGYRNDRRAKRSARGSGKPPST